MKSRAQVSFFVIISVISALILGLFLYAFNNDLLPFSNVSGDEVVNVVRACTEESLERGVDVLGTRGGVIYGTSAAGIPYRDTVDLGLTVPIWKDANSIPTLSSMEREIARYIIDDASDCVANAIRGFDDINVLIKGEMEVTVTIKEENIDGVVSYPIEIQDGNNTLFLQDITIGIDNRRLKLLHEVAKQIFLKQHQEHLFDNLVLEQILSAKDYSTRESLPSEGMFFSCRKEIWTYPQLQENIIQLNHNNFKYLHFQGTKPLTVSQEYEDYYNFKEYYDRLYIHRLPELPKNAQDVEVQIFPASQQGVERLLYFEDFKVTPNEGGIVSSQDLEVGADFNIPIPCIQIYHHLYSFSYPLIVKLADSKSGFVFQFPLKVQVENNEPAARSLLGLFPEEDDTLVKSFCSTDSVVSRNNTLLPPSRRYPLTVFVQDENSNFIEGAKIKQICGAASCRVGETVFPEFQGIVRYWATPSIETLFAPCPVSRIVAEKPGYTRGGTIIDVGDGMDAQQVYIRLNSLTPITVKRSGILLKDYRNQISWRMKEGDTVYVILKTEDLEEPYETRALFPSTIENLSTLFLVDKPDVSYDLSAFYFDSENRFQGAKMIKGWTPEDLTKERLFITIPASSVPLRDEEYTDFYLGIQEWSKEDTPGLF